MSEELVNQLTLNYLISHTQLQKLNKKIKENQEDTRNKELAVYKDRLQHLFNDLLVNQQSEDILLDVKTSFDNFIDKSVYYFKMCDTNANEEDNAAANTNDDDTNDNDTNDDDTNDDDTNDNDTNDNDTNDDDTNDDDTKSNEEDLVEHSYNEPKYCKKIPKERGTNNINNVPINWFTANLKKI
jgi:hypothetical protein